MEGCSLEQEKYRDLAAWYSHHHCSVKVNEEDGSLAVFIPLVCKHLGYDTKSGMAWCMIYKDRPKICRDYICEAAEDKA